MRQHRLIVIFFFLISNIAYASDNPFASFIGDWTLKEGKFQRSLDGKKVETFEIPHHLTRCEEINTKGSILCISDWGELEGHSLWTFDSKRSQIHQLSHFGETRNGVGIGAFEKGSNLSIKVYFQDDADGIYRIYTYTWISKNEYAMVSRQYDNRQKYTGDWYGGTFVRIPKDSPINN